MYQTTIRKNELTQDKTIHFMGIPFYNDGSHLSSGQSFPTANVVFDGMANGENNFNLSIKYALYNQYLISSVRIQWTFMTHPDIIRHSKLNTIET